MNSKTVVAGLAIGSLLVVAGLPSIQGVRAESGTPMGGPASGMVGSHEDCHTTMSAMMRMMHQHHGMMDDGAGMMGTGPEGMMDDGAGMMGTGPEGMMDDGAGMMGDSPVPEASTDSPNTDLSVATPSPSASLEAGHEQHHPSASPSASAGAS